MKSRKYINLILFIVICALLSQNTSFAQSVNDDFVIPTFPTCNNPQGTIKVSYSEGTHGIPGDTRVYTGRDTVYTLSDTTVVQCFCAPNGRGIQTNWWKVSSLSIDAIEYLTDQGWIYIPDGSVWGLSRDPFMAFNLTLSCETGGTGGTSTKKDDDDDDGEILARAISTVRGGTLGLASTGDAALIYASGAIAMVSGLSAAILKLKSRK